MIAGHGRLAAANLLNLETVPCVRLSHLSETDKRAYVLADNRLAEKAGWDNALLAIELRELADVGFDVDLTGFEAAEVDCIIENFDEDSEQPENRIPERGEGPPISRLGDTWRLGKHVLICGDATNPAAYRNLMDRERADFIFTDPPYNVRIGGNVSGLGVVKHREFAMVSGEMSQEEFTTFLQRFSGCFATTRRTARSTRSAWTGGICGKCCSRVIGTMPSLRTSASGTRPMREWGRSIAPSMNWCSSVRAQQDRTRLRTVADRR
ncbi:hypothetical protein JQ580_32040 [Bradyrhizobium japonicum]|nr:ParB/RepB/Spo0J family partition protein [Bradyrhizobium japonicum]MBR0995352.1 hypothetical protein [Bradyrhizobium japonicum]